MLPTCTWYPPVNTNLISAPGVVDVKINIKLSESKQTDIIQAVRKATEAKLGINSLPGTFDNVMMILERCYPVDTTCMWAAYAYINSYLMVVAGETYEIPSIIQHEMGHNLNLAHSNGLDGGTYSDHTCLMGDPLKGDDLG